MSALNNYMKSLGCELWPGEAFYLTDPKSRADAEQWIRDFMKGYDEYCRRTRMAKYPD